MPTATRKQNGITLIALIITIIVMLILVGVTVNVALNGGLFETANKAVKQTQREADREILQAAVIAALNEQLKIENANAILKNLPDGWDVTGPDGGPYICTSPKDNKFTVYANGTISDWVDNGDGTFTKGDTTVEIGKTTYTNAEVQEKLGATGGTYTGTWTVIGIDASGNTTKLVSTSDVAYCELGETNNLEKSISDYKTAVSTLNTVAKDATGISSARSIEIEDIYNIIGEENVNKGTSGTKWNYYYNTDEQKVYSKYQTGTDDNGEIIWSDPYNTGYSSKTFVDDNDNKVVVDSENYNASLTHTYYYCHLTSYLAAKVEALASGRYWLASPCVMCKSIEARFGVRYLDDGYISSDFLFYSRGNVFKCGNGVRAVVSVSGL